MKQQNLHFVDNYFNKKKYFSEIVFKEKYFFSFIMQIVTISEIVKTKGKINKNGSILAKKEFLCYHSFNKLENYREEKKGKI